MPHWKTMMEKEYLYAHDLDGRDVTLTIERIAAGTVVGDGGKKTKKPVAYFAGRTRDDKPIKPLALNATNCKVIAAMYGNDTAQWAAKRITLYPTTTEFAGQTVDCIRVRPTVPPASKKKEREPGEEG